MKLFKLRVSLISKHACKTFKFCLKFEIKITACFVQITNIFTGQLSYLHKNLKCIDLALSYLEELPFHDNSQIVTKFIKTRHIYVTKTFGDRDTIIEWADHEMARLGLYNRPRTSLALRHNRKKIFKLHHTKIIIKILKLVP